ncbi:MAG: serine O-acetyltransferase [Cyclobacteriaceae bacterium]
MDSSFITKIYEQHCVTKSYPSTSEVTTLITKILLILFPEQSKNRSKGLEELKDKLLKIEKELVTILDKMPDPLSNTSENLANNFMNRLSDVHQKLCQDVTAAINEDPAATDRYEVIRAYPGFYAIAFYRIAHELYVLDIPLLPRIITEFAHSKTGIDIHPGAIIEPHFYIDHGTGVVIGETCVIGKHVKLYQGVTLGALSVDKKMAQTKRHPTLEDNVVIYANATILGGETVIGANSVIGGSVWLTKSVPKNTSVYHQAQIKVREMNDDVKRA